MPNPLVAQGFLNRVKASMSVTDIPALNITASYLGKEGISVRPEGPATDIIGTMAGTVGSQVPYQQVTITAHLLKTQSLGASYQNQFAVDTALGEVVVTPDATTFGTVTALNCYLMNFNELLLNGTDAGYVVTISGYVPVNSNMWN